VHKGKDGRVRQLCVPGITTLQGRAKQVHVQQRKVPARIEKKQVEVPKYKFIWRRKEVQPKGFRIIVNQKISYGANKKAKI
jgi:hypothetical protein